MNAGELMTKKVSCVEPTTKVKELAQLLRDKKISGAPVLEMGKLVGIVTEADILSRKPGQNLVKNIMKTSVLTVTVGTSVKDVAVILAKKKIKRVPVVKEGKVVGIISRADIVRAMAG
jgi:CBS domain-containing protein